MHTLGVVDVLYEAWQPCRDIGKRLVATEVYLFGLEGLHEAFRLRIIVRIPHSAHGANQSIVLQRSSIASTGVLATLIRQADYCAAWLATLGIERAIFAGHDLGGGVIQIAAVRRRPLCAGLFLTNAIGYDSWPILSVKALRAAASLVSHLLDTAGKQILRILMYRGHDDSALAKESLDLHWAPYAHCHGAASLIRQIEALDVHDTLSVAAALPSLNVPARVVWGVKDQFQKIQYGERFARDLNAPLHRIEEGLHFTPEDHPDVIAEQLNLLIEEVNAASPSAR